MGYCMEYEAGERSLDEESYYERTLDEGAGVLNMGNRDSPSQNFSWKHIQGHLLTTESLGKV